VIKVAPDHPCWAAFNDDDWNGATFSNWVRTLKGLAVELEPPEDCNRDTVQGVFSSVAQFAEYVEIKGSPVHVLKHGFSLCMMPGLPRDWPKGNIWVPFHEKNLATVVSCATCRAEAGLAPPNRSAGE
jgi:hypothetical protein